MKPLMAIVLVIAASVALASPAACVPGTEIVSGIFLNGTVLNSSLACTEYGVTFENFSLTVVSGYNSSGTSALLIGPATGSTSISGTLELDFAELDPGGEFVTEAQQGAEFLLSYDMIFSPAPFPGEQLTLQAGPLTGVTEHVCVESGSPCMVPPLIVQSGFGAATTLLPATSEDSVLLDVTYGDRLYQTVFTPEPASFVLAGWGVLGIGLAGLVRKRAGAARRS